jgi:hypothetical protein
MAIEPTTAPAPASDAVQRAIASRTKASSNLFAGKAPELFLSVPHRIAYLGLNAIKPDADLRVSTQMGGWRFLVHERDPSAADTYALIGAATTRLSPMDEFSGLDEGPLAAGTEEAIRSVEQTGDVMKGSFDIFYLIVPALYVVALWLRDRIHTDDIIVPVAPVSLAMTPNKPISPKTFLKVLYDLSRNADAGQ